MTDHRQSTPDAAGDLPDRELPRRQADAVPEAEIKRSRGISIVWLVPLVAAAIGIWLAYTTLQERGPTITITFDNAEGLEAGKTKEGLTRFTPRVIDTDSGIGTQFVVADTNGDGLLDVVTSNKKGTFLFEQARDKK